MTIQRYNITLEEEVVKEAKKLLEVGQGLSPVMNDLLKKWIEQKKKEK